MSTSRKRAVVSQHVRPALPHHVRIQFDPVRQAWAVLSPERVFWPNEVSLDILRLCDGRSTVAAITSRLAVEYDADATEVSADVDAFLQEWADKMLVTL